MESVYICTKINCYCFACSINNILCAEVMGLSHLLLFQIESIGGFKILQEVNGGKEVSFRFHNKSKLQGGASVAVSLKFSTHKIHEVILTDHAT